MAETDRDERITRICRDQGVLRELMETFPQHANRAMWQMYYDINFLLHELRNCEEVTQ